MTVYTTRRAVLTSGAVLLSTRAALGTEKAARAQNPDTKLAALEKRAGGRLGVVAIDTATGRRVAHRADERFAMCSTFKFLAAAAVLARIDRKEERLDRLVRYTKKDLLEYAPIAKDHVADGMTVEALMAAAVSYSIVDEALEHWLDWGNQ